MRLEWLSILIVTLTVSRNCWGKVSNCVTKNCFEKTRMIFLSFQKMISGALFEREGERKKVCFLRSVELINNWANYICWWRLRGVIHIPMKSRINYSSKTETLGLIWIFCLLAFSKFSVDRMDIWWCLWHIIIHFGSYFIIQCIGGEMTRGCENNSTYSSSTWIYF